MTKTLPCGHTEITEGCHTCRLVAATGLDWRTIDFSQPAMATNRDLPGLLTIAKNFAASMARWAAAGFPTVTEKQFQGRLTTCQGCEFWKNNRCAKCGCNEKKLHLATEKCPVGKWPTLT